MLATTTEKKEMTTNIKKQTGKRKWLGRIGKFLMYGGWMLVLVLAIGIVIAISALTKGG